MCSVTDILYVSVCDYLFAHMFSVYCEPPEVWFL